MVRIKEWSAAIVLLSNFQQSGFFFYANMSGEFELTRIASAESALNADIPLFVDMKDQCLPVDHEGKIFIFSSFQPNRYKEITKEKVTYTIPVWSEAEYGAYLSTDYFWTDHKLDRSETSHQYLVARSIIIYGGSFRNVMVAIARVLEGYATDLGWLVNEALTNKGQSVANTIFVNGFRGNDAEISDVLIHRNPPINNGKIVYGSRSVVHNVASQYIFQKLVKLKEDT